MIDLLFMKFMKYITFTTLLILSFVNSQVYSKEGNYISPSSDFVYDADWCEVEGLKIPQINTTLIKSEYAKQYNREVRELYDKLKEDHDSFFKTFDGAGHSPQATYQYTVTGDILSIIIIYDYSGYSSGSDHYQCFNINIKTGQPVSADGLINIAALTPEKIIDAVKAANGRTVINSENYEKYSGYYSNGKIEYDDDHHYRKLSMYLSSEGLIMYVFVTDLPFGNGEYFIPFLPAQWLNAKTSEYTMAEAVDILRKQLNDSTVKYLLGGESESEIVNGENTCYIRAYHEGAGGAIGTFGHFYIDRKSVV